MIARPRPVGPAKQRASNHIRRLAREVQRTFPDMSVHQHLTDAAHEIDGGRMDNAKRHLDAAIGGFAPLQLLRHGIHDDEGHRAAKDFMNQAHRGRLLVMDVQSMQGENDGLAERRRDAMTSALQQRAMRNAQPDPVGRTGPDVAAPNAPQQPGSRQFANGPEPYKREPDETVTCPNCGKGDAPDAKFCDQCGHRLTPTEPYRQFKTEDITCPYCGKGDSGDARFCDQCGRRLPASAFADLSWGPVLHAIELAWHFNPMEHRNAKGEWSPSGAADELSAAAGRIYSGYPQAKQLRDAADSLRAGRLHEARDKLGTLSAPFQGQGFGKNLTPSQYAGRVAGEHLDNLNKYMNDAHPDYAYEARMEKGIYGQAMTPETQAAAADEAERSRKQAIADAENQKRDALISSIFDERDMHASRENGRDDDWHPLNHAAVSVQQGNHAEAKATLMKLASTARQAGDTARATRYQQLADQVDTVTPVRLSVSDWGPLLNAIELAGKTPPHETASGRRALKAKGQTAYGTSFPVPDISYLKKAIRSIGRAPASKRGVLKAFLKRRAAALGASALTANLTSDDLRAIDLAVSGGQVIDLVGPKGYEHGWHYVGGPGLPSSPGGGSGGGRIFMGGKQVSTHAYQQAMNASAQLQGLKTPFPHAGMPAAASHQEPLGYGHIPLSQAGQYDGQHVRGALGGGRGVVTGTYDHQRGTIRDSRGHEHKVISVDPTAHEAAFRGYSPRGLTPHNQQATQAYQAGLKSGAVYRELYKTYRGPNAQPSASTVQFGWGQVLQAIELSADTGRLASTPHPFGKPGGPGLWDVKNMELPPYIQNIARALLRTGRAKTLSQAIAIAKGATNRWSKGGGHVSPEVRAASTATNADWDAKRARAHAHTADVLSVIELYNPAGNPGQARVPQGQTGGGQFTTGGGGGGAAAGKGGAGQSRAQRKAALLATAKADRARAKMLAIKIAADRAALAAASGKKVSAQKGAVTTAKAATTGSGTPAARGAAAAASPMSAANTGLSPKAVAAATVAAKAQAGKMSKGQLIAAIRALSTQEKALLAQAAQAAAQAAKL